MPFTLSHAIAAAPLKRLLGRRAVLSALVIGCWVPDLPYFLPLNVARHHSHSTLGLLYFSLPAALLLYALYHAALKLPLIALLPAAIRERLSAGDLIACGPSAGRLAVVVSALLGAASHLAWDGFTHGDAAGPRAVPVLKSVVFWIGDQPVYGYSLAQHFSTLLGVVLLGMWVRRSLQRRPRRMAAMPGALSARSQALVLLTIAAICTVVALRQGLYDAAIASDVAELREETGYGVIAGLRTLGVCTLAYCALWQFWQARVRTLAASA